MTQDLSGGSSAPEGSPASSHPTGRDRTPLLYPPRKLAHPDYLNSASPSPTPSPCTATSPKIPITSK